MKQKYCESSICLKDNIFITAGKRSATRGSVSIERQSEILNLYKIHSFRVMFFAVFQPAAALRLRPVMQITSFRRFLKNSISF